MLYFSVSPLCGLVVASLAFTHHTTAQSNAASGIGRQFGTETGTPHAIFSAGEVFSAIKSITRPTTNGLKASTSLPVSKIYGVNLGNWLIFEPWMAPGEWDSMGGEFCPGKPCETCRQNEWSLSNYLGRTRTNSAFQSHWNSWFTQSDVDQIVADGLNTVRIPMGFWILEDIVDTKTEPYAQGGLDQLIRGLTMLNKAGIHVLLDQHALPGVSAVSQPFAGNCTADMQFYSSPDDYNYKRAVTWSIVMAWLSHVHPAFGTVFSIEALNEPAQNVALTPGIGRFEKSFVLGIRAVEASLGIYCDSTFDAKAITDTITLAALKASVPIIKRLSKTYGLPLAGLPSIQALAAGTTFNGNRFASLNRNQCLSTMFMNQKWQHGDSVPNPADVAIGPQLYDTHVYFNFGGVSDQTEESYMQVICNLTAVMDSAKVGDAPLIFGEWAISTNTSTTTSTFLKNWGDAQKLAYSQGAGWIFWTWKVDADAQVPQQAMWSYRDAVQDGLLPTRPDQYFNKDVCAPYKR